MMWKTASNATMPGEYAIEHAISKILRSWHLWNAAQKHESSKRMHPMHGLKMSNCANGLMANAIALAATSNAAFAASKMPSGIFRSAMMTSIAALTIFFASSSSAFAAFLKSHSAARAISQTPMMMSAPILCGRRPKHPLFVK
eukprot:30802-Pelagococcus_subviridis.AAC.29